MARLNAVIATPSLCWEKECKPAVKFTSSIRQDHMQTCDVRSACTLLHLENPAHIPCPAQCPASMQRLML